MSHLGAIQHCALKLRHADRNNLETIATCLAHEAPWSRRRSELVQHAACITLR